MNAFGSSARWNTKLSGVDIRQYMTILGFNTPGRGFVEITEDLRNWMRETDLRVGMLSLLCQHSSASLLVCDKDAPDEQENLLSWLENAVPEDANSKHEGKAPGGVPETVRAMLTGHSLTVPVADGRLMLGKSQGIFLLEHSASAHQCSVAALLAGE